MTDARRMGRTSQVEAPSERTPATGNRTHEVGLVPPPTRARRLGRARRHLLLLDLEDGRESGRGRSAAGIAVYVGRATLSLRGRERVCMAVEEGGLWGIDCVTVLSVYVSERGPAMGRGS